MYEIFVDLLQKNNLTPYQFSKKAGVPQSSLSDWKCGKSTPKQDKLKKIADYFGVSVDYLMTGEEKEKTPPVGEVLTEGERLLIKLYRSISDDRQPMAIKLMECIANTPTDKQQMALSMLSAALGQVE